jgi:sulfide:quinone oxidoreductase
MRTVTRHVIVAGGGFAAVEAVLALRALAQERVTIELVSRDALLRYRPSATGEPFGVDEVVGFDLAGLARGAGATFRRDVLASVMPAAHTIRLASGTTRRYGALVLALGARRRAGIPGALTFRDERDVHHIAGVLDDVRAGEVGSIVFAAPLGVAWTLPLYELALMTARRLDDEGLDATVRLVTPEARPLEPFGPEGSDAVHDALVEHGVHLDCDARPRAATRDGLELRYGGLVPGDRVVAVPQLLGPPLPGVPADWNGFLPIDADSAVVGLDDVYAAGDLTDFPVKQGGLATQQADAAARAIAAAAGVPVAAERRRYVLRARLLGPREPLYLRAELDPSGRPVEGAGTTDRELPWWPSGKVVGRHLSPRLAELEPVRCAA